MKKIQILISFIFYGISMVFCLAKELSPAIAIIGTILFFFIFSLSNKVPMKTLLKMSWKNMPSAMTVLVILAILGALTGLWRSCGTIPFCIYYGVRFIKPEMFILVVFLINVLLSMALGTSLGVASTSGVVLISLGRFGGVNPLICAGAIMSGIYFGDRSAPTSSCASLVAAITKTKLYDNIRLMHKTALIPYAISLAFYGFLSIKNPLGTIDEALMNALCTEFSLSFWAVLPAIIILVLPLLKVPLYLSMAASGLAAFLVSIFCQHMSFLEVVKTAFFGFSPEGGILKDVITGGGLFSMIMSLVMVSAAAVLTGLLQSLGILDGIQKKLKNWSNKIGRLPVMDILGLASCMIFCNQTTSNMMQQQLMSSVYPDTKEGHSEMAIDISNSGVLFAAFIPWNVACSIPLDVLEVNGSCLPYAILLYSIPICYLFTKKLYSKDFYGGKQ